VVVRALATGEVEVHQLGMQLFRELRVALLNAMLLVPMLFGVCFAWRGDLVLAALVAASMMLVFLYSATVGTVIPMLLARRGVDPAIATGPFITTSNDIVGVLVYLSLVTWAFRVLA
jgi:magnesium transporter